MGFMQKAIVSLACGHTVELVLPAPEPGALQFCYGCDDYRAVAVVPRPFVVKCASRRNCYMGTGRTYEDALDRLETHRKNKPEHVVKISLHFTVVGIYAGRADGYSMVVDEERLKGYHRGVVESGNEGTSDGESKPGKDAAVAGSETRVRG